MFTLNSQEVMATGVVTSLAALSVAATIGWIRWSAARWHASLESFHRQHHGYRTSSDKKQVLVDCMSCKRWWQGNEHLQRVRRGARTERGLHIETYVTSSANDLMNLTSTVNFNDYSEMIAVLAGDSSVYELIQTTMKSHQGHWPFAPLLILPGGSGNVLSAEFHGLDTTIHDISKQGNGGTKRIRLKVQCWWHDTVCGSQCL